MLTKIPGVYMSAYQSVQFFANEIISEIGYSQILNDFLNSNPTSK